MGKLSLTVRISDIASVVYIHVGWHCAWHNPEKRTQINHVEISDITCKQLCMLHKIHQRIKTQRGLILGPKYTSCIVL